MSIKVWVSIRIWESIRVLGQILEVIFVQILEHPQRRHLMIHSSSRVSQHSLQAPPGQSRSQGISQAPRNVPRHPRHHPRIRMRLNRVHHTPRRNSRIHSSSMLNILNIRNTVKWHTVNTVKYKALLVTVVFPGSLEFKISRVAKEYLECRVSRVCNRVCKESRVASRVVKMCGR